MTIGKIADRVAFYLQKDRSTFLSADGTDWLIEALNTARKAAESQHDFIYQQALAWLTVDPLSGSRLENAKLVSDDGALSEALVKVKSVDTVYLQNEVNPNALFPLWVDPKKLLAVKAKERNYLYRGFPLYRDDGMVVRHPADVSRYIPGRPMRGYFQGTSFRVDPAFTDSRTVLLDCQLWMDNYEGNWLNVLAASSASNTVIARLGAPVSFAAGAKLFGANVSLVTDTGSSLSILLDNFPALSEAIVSDTWTPFTNTNVTTGENAEDWMCRYGDAFLFFSAVCEVNMLTRQFAYRSEGYVSPPEKQRDDMFGKMVLWDEYMWEGGRQPLS